MAISTEVIRKITIQGSTQGVDQATDSLNKLAAAQGNVAVVTDTSSKKTLSAAQAYERQTLSVVAGAREQANYEKAVKTAKSALDQGIISNADYAARVDLLKDKFGQAGVGAKAFAAATSGVSGQLIALSAGAGPVGVFLSALGPWGIAAAVGLGGAVEAFKRMTEAANEMGQWASRMQSTAETIGITTGQLLALNAAAAKVDVTAESNAGAFERFQVGLGQLKQGTGALFTELQKVNPALVNQLSVTKDNAVAWSLLAKAYAAADAQQQVLISRAAFGRGGAGEGRVLLATDAAGGVNGLVSAQNDSDKITQEQIKHWAELSAEIKEATELATRNIAAIFTSPVLESELKFVNSFLDFARAAREFSLSPSLQKFMTSSFGYKVTQALDPHLADILYPPGSAGSPYSDAAGQKYGPQLPASDTFDQRFGGLGTGPATSAASASLGVQLANLKAQVSILGDAATATDKYNLRIKELDKVQEDDKQGLLTNYIARARTIAALDLQAQRTAALVAILGPTATVQQQVAAATARINDESAKGPGISDAQKAALIDLARQQALGTAQINAQIDSTKVQAATIFMSAGAAAAYTAEQTLLNEAIRNHKVLTDADKAAIHDAAQELGKQVDLQEKFKQASDYGQQFTNNFVQGILQGKNAVDSLKDSLSQMASSLATGALKSLFTGDFVMAAVQGIAALGAAVLGNQIESSAQKKADAQAQTNAQALLATLSGGAGASSLSSQGAQLNQQTSSAVVALAGKNQALAWQLIGATNDLISRQQKDFLGGVQGTIDALKAGLGDDSPFAQARSNVTSLTASIKDFVGNLTFLADKAQDANGQADRAARDTAYAQIAAAQAAGRDFLLTLLQAPKDLSDVQTALGRIQGTASSLQQALVDLGSSADDATKAIADGVKKAMDSLTTTFTADLTSRLNAATGKSFLNDITALVAQHQQDLADAASLGLSSDLANSVFAAEAQKIVDDNQLIGQSYADLVSQYPDLIGKTHEYTQALTDQAAVQAKINSGAGGVLDFINSLQSGQSSTLSPGAVLTNAQAAYGSNLTLAQGNPATQATQDAIGKFPELADNLEKAARAVYASGQGYQDIRSQIINQGLTLPTVQAADDPVVVAQRDTIAAIQALQVITETLFTNNQAVALGLATDQTVAGIVPGIDTLGISKEATVAQIITAAQLAEQNLAKDPTLANQLTKTQLQSLNLALDTSVLTKPQLQSLGLSTDQKLGTLLTPAQLTSAGLSKDTTLGTLLTVGQLAQQGLATNSGPLAAIQAYTDVTKNVLSGAISGGPLTAIYDRTGYLQYLPYVQATSENSGYLTHLANLDVVKTNTDGISQISTNTGTLSSISTAITDPASGQKATYTLFSGANGFQGVIDKTGTVVTNTQATSDSIGANDNTGVRGLLTLLNSQLTGSVAISGGATTSTSTQYIRHTHIIGPDTFEPFTQTNTTPFGVTSEAAQFNGGNIIETNQALPTTLNNPLLIALNKIVFNTFAIAHNTAEANIRSNSSNSSAANWLFGTYATGGVIPAGGLGLVSEHSPGGGRFIRAGNEPITVSPFSPSFGNDNEMVAELRALRAEVKQLREENNKGHEGVANHVSRAVVETGDKQVKSAKDNADKTTSEMRMTRRTASL